MVIEDGWNPALRIVAIRTRRLPCLRKLARVRVLVAILTDLRRPLELYFLRPHGSLMASAALHRTMRAEQGEFRFRVVIATDVSPGSCVVAGLTAQGLTAGTPLRHAVLEFAVMRVSVACGAAPVFEMEKQDFVRPARCPQFMAIGTRYRRVRASQQETGVPMFGDRKCGAMEILYGVATFTFVLVRCGGKLAVVGILVAIQAGRKFHLVNCVFACG